MTERPYRSGKQRPCLICRQSGEIQETVKKMGIDHTYHEVAEWLKIKGIDATDTQVRFFLKKVNVPSRKKTISPNGDYKSRMLAYTDQLLIHTNETYTIHNLGLKGLRWTAITTRLHHADVIQPMREYVPIRWKILASKDEIRAWRDSELKRLADKADTHHR